MAATFTSIGGDTMESGGFHVPRRTRLSRREAQIMEVLYRRGSATVAEVQARMPDPPGYSSVRKQLEILEAKGQVTHFREGRRYIYSPTVTPDEASVSALRQVVTTFFAGSASNVVAALLQASDVSLPDEELDRIVRLAEDAKRGAS